MGRMSLAYAMGFFILWSENYFRKKPVQVQKCLIAVSAQFLKGQYKTFLKTQRTKEHLHCLFLIKDSWDLGNNIGNGALSINSISLELWQLWTELRISQKVRSNLFHSEIVDGKEKLLVFTSVVLSRVQSVMETITQCLVI